MFLDMQNLFTGVLATGVIVEDIVAQTELLNIIDLRGVAGTEKGGTPIEVLVQVTEAITAAGALTLQFHLQTSPNADASSPVILQSSRAIPKAELVAGFQVPFSVLPKDCQRYLEIGVTIGTGPGTAGSVLAGLALDRQTNV